jgi:ribonucleoside-diphosphate reductase alpha chain
MTTNRDIPFAKSLVDYIFRWLGMEFIEGYRETNAPQRLASTPRRDAAASAARIDAIDTNRSEGAREHGAPRITSPAVTPAAQARSVDASSSGATITEILARRESLVIRPDGSGSASTDALRLTRSDSLSHLTAALQSDAPACDECGTIMVRNGTCYRCLNCGNAHGCG